MLMILIYCVLAHPLMIRGVSTWCHVIAYFFSNGYTTF